MTKIILTIFFLSIAIIKENATYNIPELMQCDEKTCWVPTE